MITKLGDYEVLSEIGRGGMGIVYLALDRANERLVAIKHLVLDNVDPLKQREFRDRFRREAVMARRLDHPNIVLVHEVGTGEDDNFYVMEFLDGHSLRDELASRSGAMLPEEFFPILKQVSDGLSYAHNLNLVHRDVKPDNIFILKDGRIKLTDFGIARMVDYEQTHLTKTGVMLGTLAYISPEQLQDAKNVDHRADIFSLGVVSYEALSGRLPFPGEGIAQTVIKVLSSEPESLNRLSPAINVEIAAVVSKALRKKARDRYMSVVDFARDFELALQGHSKLADRQSQLEGSSVPRIKPASGAGSGSAKVYTPGIPIEGLAQRALEESRFAPSFLNCAAKAEASVVTTKVPSNAASYYLVKPIGIIGRKGEGNGCFLEPSIVCARSGRVVVADTQMRTVKVFTCEGRWLYDISPNLSAKNSKTSGGSLTNPSGVAMDFRGHIYVCDAADHYIRIFDGQGRFVKEFLNMHGKEGGIQGIVLDSTGLLYVSDVDNGCLQVFQSEMGTWLRKVGVKGTKAGQLQLPSGLARDRLNQVYVVDYGTSRISMFSKAGIFMRTFGGRGAGNGLFNVPRGVAVDKDDRIYVSDSLNHRLQIFGPAGDWLYSFGGKGAEFGKFVAPAGICIDPQTNCLYVADRGNHRLQVFELIRS